ncbi:protein croquemort-like isoform X2 [Brevipalpus obovatus]|uniref:protein croquemort-like isoform X2 n=1 Tax=Brevipalpus obovatus TaxID=246614 RepID=UPI003D9F38C0
MTSLTCNCKWAPLVLLTFSCCLALSSLLILFVIPSIIQNQISESLPLLNSTDSRTFDKWEVIPLPIVTNFYIFNITNPEEVENDGQTPIVQELGPYVYVEYRKKINISYSENESIVKYAQRRTWYYKPELSRGSLSDPVYHLNVPLVAAGDYVKRSGGSLFIYYAVNEMAKFTHSKLITKHTVGQLLFEGYEDKLIDAARKMKMPVPYDKFGWFYGRNHTVSDGIFEVYTGKSDLNRIDEMYSWNGNHTLKLWWGDQCNSLKDVSASDFQRPFQETPLEKLNIFVGDICRSLDLPFNRSVYKHSVKAHRYAATEAIFNYDVPENICWCENASRPLCPPSGVGTIAPCQHGSPSAASLPHFLHGDPVLRERVRGLEPNPHKHEFYMDIEPTLGIATKVKVAMQINVLLERNPKLEFSKKIPFDSIYFPMIWFSAGAEVDESMAKQLKLLQNLPIILNSLAALFASVGIVMLLIILIVFRVKLWPKEKMQLVPTQEPEN